MKIRNITSRTFSPLNRLIPREATWMIILNFMNGSDRSGETQKWILCTDLWTIGATWSVHVDGLYGMVLMWGSNFIVNIPPFWPSCTFRGGLGFSAATTVSCAVLDNELTKRVVNPPDFYSTRKNLVKKRPMMFYVWGNLWCMYLRKIVKIFVPFYCKFTHFFVK